MASVCWKVVGQTKVLRESLMLLGGIPLILTQFQSAKDVFLDVRCLHKVSIYIHVQCICSSTQHRPKRWQKEWHPPPSPMKNNKFVIPSSIVVSRIVLCRHKEWANGRCGREGMASLNGWGRGSGVERKSYENGSKWKWATKDNSTFQCLKKVLKQSLPSLNIPMCLCLSEKKQNLVLTSSFCLRCNQIRKLSGRH